MKKLFFLVLTALTVSISMISVTSCNDYETYAEQKDKEKKAIKKFLDENDFVGKINVISEAQFYAQDTMTDCSKNEFVLFNEDGIYMQLISKGEGKSMIELAKEMPDSTVNKVLLCRFLAYDIENADTTLLNLYTPTIVDKMLCNYKHRSHTYSASFTEGFMFSSLKGSTTGPIVPDGWLKPMDYIKLSRDAGKIAKVRLIVPHASGTPNSVQYVLPYYYEISYQLGR